MPRKIEDREWVKNGFVFRCDGIGYTVTSMGGTACIGPVDAEGNALGDVFKPPETTPSVADTISKLPTNGNLLTIGNQGSFETLNNDEKPKHPGGRPRIEAGKEMSKTTKWRREKDLQGVLF